MATDLRASAVSYRRVMAEGTTDDRQHLSFDGDYERIEEKLSGRPGLRAFARQMDDGPRPPADFAAHAGTRRLPDTYAPAQTAP